MAGLIRQNLEHNVLTLTMDDSSTRNALSEAMTDELHMILDAAEIDYEVRVIVLAAEGPAFSSGHDLKEMTAARKNDDGGLQFFRDAMANSAELMKKIVRHRVPVIADIRGVAAAAGCLLVTACDLAVASEESRFITPGVNIGLFCSTPMVGLSRNISRKHAMEMLLCGDVVDARRAEQMGLVNRVVPLHLMDETVTAMASTIASKSSLTLKIGKQAFYKQVEMTLDEAYEYTTAVMAENMMNNDANEGIGAFIEKRPPNWTDS